METWSIGIYSKKNVLIYDGGQHTVDTYFNKAGLKGINSTWENLSMMEIIKNTRRDVRLATNGKGDFQNYAFDKLITSDTPGKIIYGRRQVYDMTNDILKNTEKIAEEAAKELDVVYDNLNEVDVLICAGGTGKAFFPYFKKYYNYEGLDVLLAEKTGKEETSFTAVFANVVGFFNCLIAELQEELNYDEEPARKAHEEIE